MTNLLTTLNRTHAARLAVLAALLAAVAAIILVPGRALASGASPGLVIEGDIVSGTDINRRRGRVAVIHRPPRHRTRPRT